MKRLGRSQRRRLPAPASLSGGPASPSGGAASDTPENPLFHGNPCSSACDAGIVATSTAPGGDSSLKSFPPWSMGSLLAAVGDSPSPICSSSSGGAELFSKRNQAPTFVSEIDEWLSASDFGTHQRGLPRNNPKESEGHQRPEVSPISDDERKHLKPMDHSSEAESSAGGGSISSARPKPYAAFLEEIKKQRFDDQINDWKKAKQAKFLNKLKEKEDAINNWESKKTKIAIDEMKKVVSKLENKRAKAEKKMQGKVERAQRKAEEEKARKKKTIMGRVSIINKISEKVRSSKSRTLVKLMTLC